jgi:hypothetical protein
MLAIAYHNLALECELLNDVEGATQAYYKAMKLGENHLGVSSKLTEKFKASYDEMKEVYLGRALFN